MKAIVSLVLQWNFTSMDVIPVLYLTVSIFLVYLLVRILIAGRHFLEILTAYFQQRLENERRNSEE